MDIAIQIPDEVGRAPGVRSANVARGVLKAVTIEAYRTGAITPTQVQEMPSLRSRGETEAFLRRAEAYQDCTKDDLERDIAAVRDTARQ